MIYRRLDNLEKRRFQVRITHATTDAVITYTIKRTDIEKEFKLALCAQSNDDVASDPTTCVFICRF